MLCSLGLFLLRGLWLDDLIVKDAKSQTGTSQLLTSQLITVKTVNVSFGGGRMSSFYFDKEKSFESFKQELSMALSNIDRITSISESEYFNTRLNKSIEYTLMMSLSQGELLSILSSQELMKDQIKGEVRSILLVAREMNKIWVITDAGFYEVYLKIAMVDPSNQIDNLEEDSSAVAFQTVSQRFGLPAYKVENGKELYNQVLIPKFSLPMILPVKVEPEIALADVDALRNLARNVFGNRLDFVQEARDVNGSMVFLYGYGDKALRVSKEGIIEYSERFRDQLKDSIGLIESLQSALSMLEKIGGPINEIYLNSIEQISKEGVSGYRFEFGYRIDNYSVISIEGYNGASVEVYGGVVKSAYRNVYKYNSFKALTNEQTSSLETDDAQFFNMISQKDNFTVIEKNYYRDLSVEEVPPQSIESGQAVLNSLQDVYVGFYYDKEDKMLPGVVLQFGSQKYCIDFYTYNLINKE